MILPQGAKVTWPTRPWMGTGPHGNYAHVPSFYTADPGTPLALCHVIRVLTEARPDLPPCPRCVEVLTGHGLWPL